MPNNAKVDDPHIERAEAKYEYVTVPETDLFDAPHPTIRINMQSYGPGTHKLDPITASTVKERLATFQRYSTRILQPKKDVSALMAVAKGTGTDPRGYTDN